MRTVYADGAMEQFFYNSIGQLNRQIDPDGIKTLLGYNAQGRNDVVAINADAGEAASVTAIGYAGIDRVKKSATAIATKSEGGDTYTVRRTTTQIWESDNQDVPLTISIIEQSMDGRRVWQTNRGLTTSVVTDYDGLGGRKVTTTGSQGIKTIQHYVNDRVSSTTVETADGTRISGTTYGYDPHGRLATVGDARNGVTTYTYWDDDRIHTVTSSSPDETRSGEGYAPQTTTYVYDSMGRAEVVTQPDGGVVHMSYWPTGKIKRTWGVRTYPVEYGYDPQGRVKTLTTWQDFTGDTGKTSTTWTYNAQRGWLLNKRYADGTGPSYTYKASGRLLTRTSARIPAITATYRYNVVGDIDKITYSDTTPGVTVTYDRAGRAKTIADGAGIRSLSYHASGELGEETFSAGLLSGFGVTRSFDEFHRLGGISLLDALASTVNSVAYGYDSASRLETVTSGVNRATYAYVPDSPLVGALTLTNSGAVRLTNARQYDQLNRLASISHQASAAGEPTVRYSYVYNAANQRIRSVREDLSYWSHGYDLLGQLSSTVKHLPDEAPVLGREYDWTFDDVGNRRTATTNGTVSTYTASALNQYSQRTIPSVVDVIGAASAAAIVNVELNDGSPEAVTRQDQVFFKRFTVDNSTSARNVAVKVTGVRNLMGPNGEDAVAEVTKTAFVPQNPESYVHDGDGNLTDDALWHYVWDAENRLASLETSAGALAAGVGRRKLEFAYDYQGRRFAKKLWSWGGTSWTLVSHTLFVYDGWNLLAEFNAMQGNAPIRTYCWGLDLSGSMQGAGGVGGLLAVTTAADNATYFAAFDGNGNVVSAVNASDGSLAATFEYGGFGETLAAEGPASERLPLGFSTKYTDSETGLIYYGFRYYQPTTGRWLSRDPIHESGGINLYAYVENSPLNYVDPLGLTSSLITAEPALLGEFGIGAPTAGTIATTISIGTGATAVIVHATKEGDKDDAPAVPIPIVKEQCPKDPCKQLENRLNEHIDKLGKYKANPDAYDNNNYLKNNPTLRDRIINGRIRHLENEIKNFQRLLENCRKTNPNP